MIGYEELYIYDVFESVILEMKSSGSIISIVDNSGTWTITTTDTGNLKDNFKVKIGSNYFRVQNVDSTFKKTFEIVTSTDLASETNWEMFIDFQLGSRVEVTNYLSQKDSN
ncbi:MAG: hypothetical protein GY870_03945, partial [archaeon]|nr:hypothetical protein [archaeon]